MAEQDRIKWNRKHLTYPTPEVPSGVVKRFFSLAPEGRALDIASGLGRNAFFLAEHGIVTEAVDISDIALGLARKHSLIRPVCVDLDTFEIPSDRYALIVNIRYVNRRLFPYMKKGLIRGGLLIFESFLEDTAATEEVEPDFLLMENELLHSFLSLKIIHYEETDAEPECRFKRKAVLVGIKR